MKESTAGLDLSERFYRNLVEPIVRRECPALQHAAARIGLGSEVLGYDTDMSSDHDYGPSAQVFLPEPTFPEVAKRLMAAFERQLPETFEGWSVRFPANVRPRVHDHRPGMLWSQHGVEVYTVDAWSERFLHRRFNKPLEAADWLAYPEQYFLAATAGRVFLDELGELTVLRDRLAFFPQDVWLYKLGVQWHRVAEERAYVGRTGSVGDEIGSSVVGARMVEHLMRIALLIERKYAPYGKWLGTAFSRLPCASDLSSNLEEVLAARKWKEREDALFRACCSLAHLQIERRVPGAIEPTAARLHDRPFRFVDSGAISAALLAAIQDHELRHRLPIGGADQFLSTNFIKAVPVWCKAASEALEAHAVKGSLT